MCRCNCPRSIRAEVLDYSTPPTPAATVRVGTVPSCWICGGDPAMPERMVKLGMQMAVWDTYRANLQATADREAAEAARQAVNRWHE